MLWLARSITALTLSSLGLAVEASADAAQATKEFRGVVRTLARATISSELSAKVKRLGVREGQFVAQQELLIEFDCRRQEAELEALLAELREMRAGLESNKYLAKNQAASILDVEISAARAAKAEAAVASLKVQLEQCEVHAPFAGTVSTLSIHQHETSAPGRPLLTLIGNTDLEVALIIPSSLVMSVTEGTRLAFTLDETGETLPVRIVRSAALVDSVSQTAMVIADFDGVFFNVVTGMSGTARLVKDGG